MKKTDYFPPSQEAFFTEVDIYPGCGYNSIKIKVKRKEGGRNMRYTFKPSGVCSTQIDFDIEDGKVRNVKFTGGCNGNLKGISQLVEGMDAGEVAGKLRGTLCGFKQTSCPDQFAQAIEQVLAQQ